MRNVLILLTTLALSSQTAFAGRSHRGGRGGHRGGHVTAVQHRGGGHTTFHRGTRTTTVVRRDHRGPARWDRRTTYVSHGHYVRRPAWGRHYYDRYHRPALIVEHYSVRPGYVWVAGHWTWNGYEWLWQAGYYQADAVYYGY